MIQVVGRDIEKAIKQLKKGVEREGLFRELKNRRYYEKPSVKKRRKQREARRRRARAARFKKKR